MLLITRKRAVRTWRNQTYCPDYPCSMARFCQPCAGARRKLADDRKVVGAQADPDDGAVCPSGALFGQGLGGPGRRQQRRGLPARLAPAGFRRRLVSSCKSPGVSTDSHWRGRTKLAGVRIHDLRHSYTAKSPIAAAGLSPARNRADFQALRTENGTTNYSGAIISL